MLIYPINLMAPKKKNGSQNTAIIVDSVLWYSLRQRSPNQTAPKCTLLARFDFPIRSSIPIVLVRRGTKILVLQNMMAIARSHELLSLTKQQLV
jgi:hypothetical protein